MLNPNFISSIAQLNLELGGTSLTFLKVYEFHDNAQCMIHMGKEVLPVFTKGNPAKADLDTISTIANYVAWFYGENQLRAITTGYFNETVNNFKKVTSSKEGVQWAFYSAHDTTVMAFISRMGLASAKCVYENYLNGTILNS